MHHQLHMGHKESVINSIATVAQLTRQHMCSAHTDVVPICCTSTNPLTAQKVFATMCSHAFAADCLPAIVDIMSSCEMSSHDYLLQSCECCACMYGCGVLVCHNKCVHFQCPTMPPTSQCLVVVNPAGQLLTPVIRYFGMLSERESRDNRQCLPLFS